MGGWQADLDRCRLEHAGFALPAAGVILSSAGGTATLTNDGSIGALSDRAVAGDPQDTSIINNGTITGFVQFTGGDNSILNNGTFNLRHFADTNGDGVRDTLRVAIADLGAGANNSFTNNGTLALPAVTGATTLDSTGQYLPLGNTNNTMALGGPLQGHLIGVATFTNSGTIDLQSNPAAGDVLVITGARQAGGARHRGVGPGTYISNGGTLKLDTVLNRGGPATTISDTLVVDGTSVGPNGATKTVIRNAGGEGALTVGDGILVVEVKDPNRSAAGAFALANPHGQRRQRLTWGLPSTGCSTVASTAATLAIGFCARPSRCRPQRRRPQRPPTSSPITPPTPTARYRRRPRRRPPDHTADSGVPSTTLPTTIRRRTRCRLAPIRSSGHGWRPMAWCSRSPDRWVSPCSARCMSVSATH